MNYIKLLTNLFKYFALAALFAAALVILTPPNQVRAKTKIQVVRNDGARFDIPRTFVDKSASFNPSGEMAITGGKNVGTKNLPGIKIPRPGSVIGPDNRKYVSDTTHFPNSAIAQIEVQYPSGLYTCTAWMIGPQTLATAGHCVYYEAFGGFATAITVYPGRNGGLAPFGSYAATHWFVSSKWIDSHNKPKFDYAAITIGTDISSQVGYFGFATNKDDSFFQARRVKLWGYPGDKPYGTQWKMKRKIAQVNGSRFFYSIDTGPGQSGSPVFNKWTAQCKPCVFGIHTYGVAGNWDLNSATRINRKAFNFLCQVRGGC